MPKAVKRKAALDKTELRLDKILKTSPTKKRHRRKRHGSGPSEQLTLRRAATITVEENDSSDDTHASGLISDAATGTSRNTPIDLDTVCSFILKDGNSTQMLKIPSGLTKLALQTGETINTLNVPQFDLIDQVDDEEMATALESLKSIPKSSTAAKSVQRQGDSSTRLISGEAIRQNTRTDLDTVCSFISKEDNSRTQMFKIPSGLTKLALSPGDTINTQSDLIDPIGDDEIAMALESLKTKLKVDASTLSTEAVQRLSKSSASDTTEPGLKAVTNRKKQRVNIKGATSSTSHRRVSRPKRHIRKPNKFSTEYSFKMSKPVPKKKPVVQTSKMDKGIKNNKQLQASTTIQKLQEKPAMKTKSLRERATDTQFGIPLLKFVKWTEWKMIVCGAIPPRYSKSDFKQPRNSSGFFRKIFAGQTGCLPSVLEFGVKLPTGKKVWAMCYRKHYQNKDTGKYLLASLLLKNNEIHKEIESILKENCEVYLRWATPFGKDKKVKLANFEAAVSYIESFDYAWSRHGKNGHRRVLKHGVLLSDKSE